MYRILCITILLASTGCRERPVPDIAASPPKSDTKQDAPSNKAAHGEIDSKEAVRLAEQFIRDQGYTDFLPKDTSKLQPESFTTTEREKWLSSRKNMLLPKARGAMKGELYNAKGWTVGFALVKPLSDPDVGLAVTMDEFGENLVMQHQGFNLKYLETEAR